MRDAHVDLIRTALRAPEDAALLAEPTTPFKLVVNVSAPEGSGLNYEAESYRITRATAGRCAMVPTELGTAKDLVDTTLREQPTGIHFSGHGSPGNLLFEDNEGRDAPIQVQTLLEDLRRQLPDGRPLPPFFYLASCHGNDPTGRDGDDPVAAGAALQLHGAGVTEVVGYTGPIVDELSTLAEETLYQAVADGQPTRDALRLARQRLSNPPALGDERHRPTRTPDASPRSPDTGAVLANPFPFAWAQLVLYRRGPEWPLSPPSQPGKQPAQQVLQREFHGFLGRRVLRAGFIGRRREQHQIRRRLRQGQRVLVLQGLGGLGKSTLAQQVLPWLVDDAHDVCTLWCHQAERAPNRAEALVGQLLGYCRDRFGADWEGVVQQVDRQAGSDSGLRFLYYLQVLTQKVAKLLLHLDNLESLLIGPEQAGSEPNSDFADWAEPALAQLWQQSRRMAEDGQLWLIASCRYRSRDFAGAGLPLGPLPDDALYRLTAWMPALQRLHPRTRMQLVARLDGHPRAVEFADDLIRDAHNRWQARHGDWRLPAHPGDDDLAREWTQLIAPALPQVEGRLRDDLLLQAIWDRVLEDPARRFLVRMCLLRRPADWDLLMQLGDAQAAEAGVEATAERLRDSSLLEQREAVEPIDRNGRTRSVTRYALHPATARFVRAAHGDDPTLTQATHARLGAWLGAEAKDSPYIDTDIEAGYHLFAAGEADRALELLGPASNWLQEHGRVREGLELLEPFLEPTVLSALARDRAGRLLGTIGTAHYGLADLQQAIGYHEQALVIDREIGYRRGEGADLGNLGNAYAKLGEIDKARTLLQQALAIGEQIRAPRMVQTATNALAQLDGSHGRSAQPGRGARRWLVHGLMLALLLLATGLLVATCSGGD